VFGLKVTQTSKVRQIQRRLIASLEPQAASAPAPERERARTADVGH
jgi:hypothetical protein